MKRLFFTALACIFLAVPGIALAERFQKVDYIAGSIAEKDGSFIRLLDGSSWVLTSPSLALVTDDVIIIFEPAKLHNRSVTGSEPLTGERSGTDPLCSKQTST